jgi:hypothetical protein
MNGRRSARSAWWAIPLTVIVAACSTSLGTAGKVEPPVAQAAPLAASTVAPSAPLGEAVAGSLAPIAQAPTDFRVPRRSPPIASPEAMPPVIQPPPLEAFAMNLYQPGDFVPQHTFEWCVAASVQMAWNMAMPDVRSSYDDQQTLWNQARDRSNNPFRGADPGGWAQLLNDLGLGPYELVSVPEYGEALRVAAAALRDTGRSVGLVMWRGRHAWVMNGFESMGDPALRPDFQVTGINVVDPLYPYGSGTWGPSPQPNQLLSPDELATQFVFREQRRWSSHIPSGFLLVLPVASEAVAGSDVTGGPASAPPAAVARPR